ncbi:MAG: DegT/DnrJ/EryC1/StrS family aminotransferase [Bacteroidetes bacterium]|nr:MAG: DegT/DnrJ/EryC1/StrS family aminotransferase [Bacteroidota bacterium]
MIPFSLPLIDQDVINEVHDCLTNTGWLTSGPKVAALEAALKAQYDLPAICVNSWTSGAMLMLRWFGVGAGDEVIIPAYTYSATALCALNIGAKVVMVDVEDDFTLSPALLAKAITPRTKAIIPVDLGGWPCDYDALRAVVDSEEVRRMFTPANEVQEQLGRPLLLTDAAHSIGARYKGMPNARGADATIFSFHSVKNVTTGEGGAIMLHLPAPFDPEETYRFLKFFSLNGQTKSAFEKNQAGGWRYDIVAQGLKVNMPDICAAIGLAQLRKYESTLLPERKRLFEQYQGGFRAVESAILPPGKDASRESSYHLYLLRIRGYGEAERDQLIRQLALRGVATNVHYIPMPMLTLFKNLGYRMEDYPNTYRLYKNEISLPIYNGLTEAQVDYIINAIKEEIG